MSYHLYTLDQPVYVYSLLIAILVVVGTLLAVKAVRVICRRYLLSRIGWEDREGLGYVVTRTISAVVVIAGALWTLEFLGVSATSMHRFFNQPIYTLAERPVNLLSLVVCVGVLILTYIGSRYIPVALQGRIFPRFELSAGVEYTFQRIAQYLVVVIGLLLALKYLGVKFEGLAVFAGLMSVGLGFGLQNIVSNFVSGIIILFERPVQVGERIKVGDTVGDILAIRIRSTVVRTPDNVTYIVPNSDLLTTTVTNWSAIDKKVRIHIPVGVAYGSDVEKVKRALTQAAQEHPDILEAPEPRVWFVSFGDSSLDFELLAWIPDPRLQYQVRSDLHFAVDRLFRENDITIPFPQRDLHVYETPPVAFHPDGLRIVGEPGSKES